MQPARTLIGAAVGAALGVGLLMAAYRIRGLDAVWLAIPFALLTGIGVRVALGGHARANYFRGAITALIALGAYLGGWFLVAAVAQHNAADVGKAHVSTDSTAK